MDVATLYKRRSGESVNLLKSHINPALAKLLKIVGFDREYVRGEGAYLFDIENNKYIDFIGGDAVFNIGRNHPKICKAIKDVIDLGTPNLIQMGAQLLSGLLAEELIRRAPDTIDNVFFTSSGTESIEGCIKFAKAATGRKKIAYCSRAFHGHTCGAVSLNGSPQYRKGFEPLLPKTVKIPFNDVQALDEVLKKKDVAAFVVEPIQDRGVNIASDEFLKEAQVLCNRNGTLLVCDEVQTGLGRTGKFFAFEHWGIEPDLIALSKALSGGLIPVGAILCSKQIHRKVFSSLSRCIIHHSTFGQNDLSMAAGLATLQILDEEKLVERSASLGRYLIDRLMPLKTKYEMIKDVRGRGLMVAIEFGPPSSLKLKVGWKLLHRADPGLFSQMIVMPLMSQHRILTQVPGFDSDVIKLTPPLVVTKEDLDTFVHAFEQVVIEAHKFPGAIWNLGKDMARAFLSS